MRTTLQNLSVKALFGIKPIQPTQPPEQPKDRSADIADARQTIQAFAARLRELAQARQAFDAATLEERRTATLDLASVVGRGDPLPEPGAVETARGRAEIRLKALWELANREAPGAAAAAVAVKAAALATIEDAMREVCQAIADSLPDVFSDRGGIAALSEPAKVARGALEEVRRLSGLSLRTKELFGLKLQSYRINALPPPNQRGVWPADELNPEHAARALEAILHAHGRAMRFRVALAVDLSARW